MEMEITLESVWAKTDPFQSIVTHSTLSGFIAQVIWNQMPEGVQEELACLLSITQEQGKAWLGYLVSLHDIGKVEELFQWQWPGDAGTDGEGREETGVCGYKGPP